jgi:hypothetical protein
MKSKLNLELRKRMTAHECLTHAWLTGDHSNRTEIISQSRYLRIRDRIRAKYSDWNSFLLPIGRLAEYSALRKLLLEKYKIHETSFGKQSEFIWNRIRSDIKYQHFSLQIADRQLPDL